jgi:hypothetical protein
MIRSPVLIIGAPRSGTTLVFNLLSEAPELWSIGYESKEIIEYYHHPREKNWDSGVLDESDLTQESKNYIITSFRKQAAPGYFWRRVNALREILSQSIVWRKLKRKGRTSGLGSGVSSAIPQKGLDLIRLYVLFHNNLIINHQPIRLVEKTPENCLRLPFLLKLFPDARVIYLIRDGRANIHSLMEGWRQPHHFPGYKVPEKICIPGDKRGRWAFTLIPGWRELISSPLEEVCAHQWLKCNEAVLKYQGENVKTPFLTMRYEELIASPDHVLQQVSDFLEIDYEQSFGGIKHGLPRINVVSDPDPDKWRRKSAREMQHVLPIIRPMMEQLGYSCDIG